MKKNFKRAIALILTAIVMIGTTAVVEAAEGYSGTTRHEITRTYRDEIGNSITAIQIESNGEEVVVGAGSAVTSRAEFVAAIRANLVARNTSFQITHDFPSGVYDFNFFSQAFDEARRTHTGNPQEGDYLYCTLANSSFLFYGIPKAVFSVSANYRTTAAQESAVTSKVNTAMAGMSLGSKDQVGKIQTIHDYVCNASSYSTSGSDVKYTAYGNLVLGKSVCQGYATAFYRIAIEAGLDTRIITGNVKGVGHAWNIVKIGTKYYYLDCTFDDNLGSRQYYLRGSNYFSSEGYTPDSEFKQTSFTSKYPISTTDYVPPKTSLKTATVTTASGSYAYNGTARKPSPIVTLNGKKLTYNTDYSVAFANNTNVGTATIKITGKGNYTGTATGTFKIVGTSISGATVTTKSASYAYTGTARKPAPVVTLGGKTLVVNTDYTVAYSNNINAGTATITVTGKGNYAGTAKGTFKVTAVSLAGASVKTKAASYAYTGSARKPGPVVTLGGKTLVVNTDFTVAFANNVNAGTATITITGKGNYKGTAKGTFTVSRASIKTATVTTKSASYAYTGTARKPAPIVTLGTKTLKVTTEYKVTYKNNTNKGTATITVTGVGNYTGTATGTFKIK